MKQRTLSGGTIDTVTTREITYFPTTVQHPDLGLIRIVGYIRPYKYMDGIYAYEDARTGEYGGMFLEDDTAVHVLP